LQVLLAVNKPTPVPNPPPPVLRAQPPILVPLLVGPLTAPFLISLNPDPNPAAGDFKVFAQNPFDRTRPTSHDLDHRWTINFRDLHTNASLGEGAQPMGTLKTGILYTPKLTDPILAPKLVRPGSTDIPLLQLASHLAVSIDVPLNPSAQTKVVLQWRDMGDPVDLELPRPGDDPDTVYTIYFINEPPTINADDADEFLHYYRVLETGGSPIPRQQHYELQLLARSGRTDEIPCMPGILNP
jgi:hypothetical protein